MEEHIQSIPVDDIRFQESSIPLADGKTGKIAMFFYTGGDDPMAPLDWAIEKYCDHHEHMQLVDLNMDNPWFRVVISSPNEMEMRPFNPEDDRLK